MRTLFVATIPNKWGAEFNRATFDALAMARRVRSAFMNPLFHFDVATAPRHGFVLVESGRPDPTA